jgi:hypothetical protein
MIVFWCGIALLIGIYVSIKPRVDLENGTSHQFISDVSLDNRSVWFCPVTDHGDWLCGNYTLADNVIMLPSVHWYNRTNVLVDAYWDGTWYTGDDGGTYKHLVGIYGNTSRWVLDSWVWATLSHGVVINLTEGWNESRV